MTHILNRFKNCSRCGNEHHKIHLHKTPHGRLCDQCLADLLKEEHV